jgi:hypothetical protein
MEAICSGRKQGSDFNAALARLDALKMLKELKSLCEAMSQKGLALEHEVVWLE